MTSKTIFKSSHELFHQLFLYELFYKLSPKNYKTILKIFSMLITKDSLLYNELKTLTEYEMLILDRIDEKLPKTIIEMFHFNSFLDTYPKSESIEQPIDILRDMIIRKDDKVLEEWLAENHKKISCKSLKDLFKYGSFEHITNDTLKVLQKFFKKFLSSASDFSLSIAHSSNIIKKFLARNLDRTRSTFLAHFLNCFSGIPCDVDIPIIAKKRQKESCEASFMTSFIVDSYMRSFCVNSLKEIGVIDVKKAFTNWFVETGCVTDNKQIALNVVAVINLEKSIKRYKKYNEQTISILQLLLLENKHPEIIETILERCPQMIFIRDSFGDNAFSYIRKYKSHKNRTYELFGILYKNALKIMPEKVASAMIFERHRRKSCFKKLFNESYVKLLKKIDECVSNDNS